MTVLLYDILVFGNCYTVRSEKPRFPGIFECG